MNVNRMESKNPEIEKIVERLCDKDGIKRKEAREKLVGIGKQVLEYINDLFDNDDHHCRWEAIKLAEEIGSPESIPVFLTALEDDESDIRWIAAEGLIRTGKNAVVPLLSLIIEKHDSVFVLNGAHHVFYRLNVKKSLPPEVPVKDLLRLLKHPDNGARLTVLSKKVLDKIE